MTEPLPPPPLGSLASPRGSTCTLDLAAKFTLFSKVQLYIYNSGDIETGKPRECSTVKEQYIGRMASQSEYIWILIQFCKMDVDALLEKKCEKIWQLQLI